MDCLKTACLPVSRSTVINSGKVVGAAAPVVNV